MTPLDSPPIQLIERPRQSAHQLIHSLLHFLSLSLSSSSLSLHSLTLKQEEEKERRRKERGLKLGCSKKWPWKPPRSPHPQEVGVGRGRSPLTLTQKELGGEGSKKKNISSCQGGDPAAPSSWRALHLLIAALGKDLTSQT